jgi:D-alanyl-D-alanine carboxypeptidase
MKIRKAILLKTLILTSLLSFQSCKKDIQVPLNSIQAELDKSVEQGFDGVIVYVNQQGKSSFYSAGWSNRESLTPANPHSLFKIASISKLYEAAAVTKLVAAGQLSLTSTLVELIPELEGKIEYANEITLELLLHHRSGIPDFIYHPDFEDADPFQSYMETASLIFNAPADFAPNKKYGYSNTNFLLLGEIMDRTLGYSHHDYIKNEILVPLNLNNTYCLFTEVDTNDLMSGYYKGYDPDLKSEKYTRPGGAMIATAEDVGIFLRALIDGTLFTKEEQAIYTSVYPYEHTGWAPGYTSIARYNSEIDAVVVQFVNTSYNGLFWAELEGLYGRINKILERKN